MGSLVAFATPPHRPATLLIALVSPLAYGLSTLHQNRAGLGAYKVAAKQFQELMNSRVQEADDLRSSRLAWLSRKYPPLKALSEHTATLDEHLWWRRPTDSDFLDARLGQRPKSVGLDFATDGRGDRKLIDEALDRLQRATQPVEQPVVLNLNAAKVVGLVGHRDATSGMTRSLIAQLAAEQSHRDVSIALLCPEESDFVESLKWLPHVVANGNLQKLTCTDPETEVSVFSQLRMLAEERSSDRGYGRSHSPKLPHIVAVIVPPLSISRAAVSEFLSSCAANSIGVLWVAENRALLPGECSAVITIENSLQAHLESEAESCSFIPEILDESEFDAFTRRLSPLRDISAASAAGSIPNSVDLFDLDEPALDTPERVIDRWQRSESGLSAPIGMGADGPVYIDFELDGPHALVAGMTGVGKSELLRSILSSLALHHSPKRVNFVLVDYKGGSAFDACKDLPHTVGYVTDLDSSLSERAISSLNAELRRRETIITSQHGVKDNIELRKSHPESALPSLLIVIDEFASLVQELPQFVDSIVDIARRGRSLGVHLILATQRPSGVISPQIQGNTNLRLALRTASQSDSNDILESPLAATIPTGQRGRAFLRVGQSKPIEIQCAYTGSSFAESGETEKIRANTFLMSRTDLQQSLEAHGQEGPTQLTRVVEICVSAFNAYALDLPFRPWLQPLPTSISYEELLNASGDKTVFALLDSPELQEQRHLTFNLALQQNTLLVGGPRSGKTSALCAIAHALSASPSEIPWMYGFDFGHHGLSGLSNLPTWGGTASPQDMGKVCRLIDMLDEMKRYRGEQSSLSRTHNPIVVFVDNWAAVSASLQSLEYSSYWDKLSRLINDGRGAGLFFMVTADRASAVSPSIRAGFETEFTFRISNQQDILAADRRAAATIATLPDGRAINRAGHQLQFMLPPSQPSQQHQNSEYSLATPGQQPRLQTLPEVVSQTLLPKTRALEQVWCAVDEGAKPAAVDLMRVPMFLVVGPPRSGKSAALSTLARELMESCLIDSAYLLSPKRTSLSDSAFWDSVAMTSVESEVLINEILEGATSRSKPPLVVIDDADDWADISHPMAAPIDSLLRLAGEGGLVLLVAASTSKAQRAFSGWLASLKTQQHGILLHGSPDSADVFSLRLPRPLNQVEPPGRGYLVAHGASRKVQIAST